MGGSPSRLYLDANATCAPLPEAVRAAAEAMAGAWGNPSSPHAEGRAARAALAAAREAVAALVSAAADEVVFTSGGTEANATAIFGLAPGRPLLVSAVEHPGLLAAAECLRARGRTVAAVPVDRGGAVRCDALDALLADHPGAVVAIQLANHETGVVQPVAELAATVRRAGGLLHCDAVQAAGRIPVDFAVLGATTLALAGHKFGAPLGGGALVVRAGTGLEPLVPGTQEAHRRGGTENVPAAVGLGVAARHAAAHFGEWAELGEVRDRFEAMVCERLPGTQVLGAGRERLPNTSCLVLPPPLRGSSTVAALDLAGIAVSSGPACSSGVERRSGVVEAMGFDGKTAERVLRVSFGPGIGAHEPERLVRELQGVIGRLGRTTA